LPLAGHLFRHDRPSATSGSHSSRGEPSDRQAAASTPSVQSAVLDINDIFEPLDRAATDPDRERLSQYGLEDRRDLTTGNEFTDLLLDNEWIDRTGFEDVTSRRVHLMYLHLYGNSGQSVRGEVAEIDRSRAYELMLELDWSGVPLDTVIDGVAAETLRRQAVLQAKLPSGRIPLFRGIHCMAPRGPLRAAAALQRWTSHAIRKGLEDGTMVLDVASGEPIGYVVSVEPFTSTVDSWTCSYRGAAHWSRTTLPGNEICMVMAANVAHEAVALWRNDSLAMDEVLVLGGAGTVNVYFERPFAKSASPGGSASDR